MNYNIAAAMEIDSATPSNAGPQTLQNTAETSNTALPHEFTQYLNPFASLPFVPWPTEETIRRGALASIQVLLDQGTDPATFDPERGAELEAERKRIEEEQEAKRADERARVEEERRREMESRLSVSRSLSGEMKVETEMPKVFQLETFDDDDDDESD